MKIERRQAILGAALLATLLAVVLVEPPVSDADAVAAPVRVAVADNKHEEPSAKVGAFGQLQRSDLPNSDTDPFRAKSWYVPPPPPPTAAPKPTAPPLPFRYMGMLEDQGKATVYLIRGDETFPVAVGERFADAYQLEKIERGILIINYLPLSIHQTLAIGINE